MIKMKLQLQFKAVLDKSGIFHALHMANQKHQHLYEEISSTSGMSNEMFYVDLCQKSNLKTFNLLASQLTLILKNIGSKDVPTDVFKILFLELGQAVDRLKESQVDSANDDVVYATDNIEIFVAQF